MSVLDQVLKPVPELPTADAQRTLIRAVSKAAKQGVYSAEEREQITKALRIIFKNACFIECDDAALAELGLIPPVPMRHKLVRRTKA